MPDDKPELKLKYTLFGLLFCWLCIAVAGYPAWEIAQWLAETLAIPDGVPVKEQENGWLWVALFLIEAITIFGLCYFLLSYVFARLMRWPKEKHISIFFKSRYPDNWYK